MKLLAINGSPRKSRNTAILLQHAVEGASSRGVQTELINLYDLNYRGCVSCFSCKLKDGKSYGKCVLKDDLTPILEKMEDTDALILGSPNYIGSPTGMMKNFIERLVFPYIVYGPKWSSLIGKKIPVGFIYTMSSDKFWMRLMGYDKSVKFIKLIMKIFFGPTKMIIVNDTSMFDDYSKYVSERFDPVKKAKIKAEQFPIDCKKAFRLGADITKKNRAF
jgi:multimeric flavodoxin WrbA